MKKIILTITIAAIGLFGSSAMAQSKGDKKECPKTECKKQMPGDNNKMRKPQSWTEFAFEGILLDMPQQTRIDSLNAAMKAQCEAKKADGQAQKGKCEGKECKKGCRMEMRKQYAAKVKEILTPEQYVVFLENIAFNTPEQAKGMGPKHSDGRKDMKGERRNHGDGMGKKMNKGERPQPQPRTGR